MDVKAALVISKCLLGERTRYDGTVIKNEFAIKLAEIFQVVPFCPEVEAKMSVPRDPLILVKKNDRRFAVVGKSTDVDYTDELRKVSRKFLSELKEVDGFLLKSKSPSCGWTGTKIFDKNRREIGKKGRGIFAQEIKRYFPFALAVDDSALIKDSQKLLFTIYVFLSAFVRRHLREERSFKDGEILLDRLSKLMNVLGIKVFAEMLAGKDMSFWDVLKRSQILIKRFVVTGIKEERFFHVCQTINRDPELNFLLAVINHKC